MDDASRSRDIDDVFRDDSLCSHTCVFLFSGSEGSVTDIIAVFLATELQVKAKAKS